MFITSAAFNAALAATTRTWRNRIEVLYGGDVVTSVNVLADGYVTVDDVAVRRSVSMSLADVDGNLTPADARDLLAPKGTEIRVYKGLLVDGAYEEVPLGVFGVVDPQVSSHSGGARLRLLGRDRVDAVRVRQFADPWTVVGGTPTADAITAIITSRLDVPIRVTRTGHTAPETVFDWASDPWDAVRTLADADDLSAYFDPLGTAVVEPGREVDTGITYGHDGLLVRVDPRQLSAAKTYSGVVVRAEHPEKGSFKSVLWDTDPNSPTYADGPFGRRPYGFYSQLISSQAQADEAAATLFARVRRMEHTLAVETIGTPGHDIGDVVRVIDPESRTNGYFKVTGVRVPLRLGTIQLKLTEVTGA
jgi:hypothetical protein